MIVTLETYLTIADEICKEKLGIASDRIVEKWLSTNEIKVVNEEIKEKLSKLITKYKENIIVISPKRTVKRESR